MSQWATLEAEFVGLRAEFGLHDVPKGSEDGPSVRTHDGITFVSGRLRDVSDHDAPAALAWFLGVCDWCDSASFEWDLDSGPRYRYELRDGEVRRLRGILD